MHSFPIFLVGLERRRAVVVGADRHAAVKVAQLVDAGFGTIDVIAARPGAELRETLDPPQVRLFRRGYRSEDLRGALLVIATEMDRSLNQRIAADAERTGALFNAMDDPEACDWFAGSVIRRGDLAVAIGTGGVAPALAVRLRERFERQLPQGITRLLQIARRMRPRVMARVGSFDGRRKLWYRWVDAYLARVERAEVRPS